MMKNHELSGVVYFGNFFDYKETTLTVFLHDNIRQMFSVEIPGNYQFRSGYQYRFNVSTELDDIHFGKNDYIIFNKDVKLSDVTLQDFDIIRDAKTEVEDLSIKLQNQITSNDNDIEYLSSEISSNDNDIIYLSGQHDWLSAALSLDLSNEICSRIKAVQDLSVSLSSDINSLSDRLSIEISSVSSYTTLSIENLCSEISSNDKNISDISVDLISVSNRYSNTFTNADKNKNDHISSDNLILTDINEHITGTDEHKQYYMSFESGTIVLKPLK